MSFDPSDGKGTVMVRLDPSNGKGTVMMSFDPSDGKGTAMLHSVRCIFYAVNCSYDKPFIKNS